MSTDGTAPLVGRGIAAYTVNIHVTPTGPVPVTFTAIRQWFPEVRFYSMEQGAAILAARVSHSLPVELTRILGFAAGGAGVGVTVVEKISKSPSWFGTVMTVGGLAVPVIESMLSKAAPNYQITNPPPATIRLQAGESGEYTWLCARGNAPVTITARIVDPTHPPVFSPVVPQPPAKELEQAAIEQWMFGRSLE